MTDERLIEATRDLWRHLESGERQAVLAGFRQDRQYVALSWQK